MAAVGYLLVIGSLVLATALGLGLAPGIARAVLAGEGGRKHALDGLRGLLALTVLVHHLLLGRLATGPVDEAWLRAHPFTGQLGAASVAMFFAVSAYLFGGRVLRDRGRLDVPAFLTGRILRIVPLYLLAVGVAVFISFAAQGFALVEPPAKLARQIGRHLLFDFVPRWEINGFDAAGLLLGPVWSLRYEWLLYAALPVMAWFYRLTGRALAMYLPLLVGVVLVDGRFWFFAAGLAVAQVAASGRLRAWRGWPAAGAVSLVALFACFHTSDDWPQAALVAPALAAVVGGGRAVLPLARAPLRFLGEISFGVYLLHSPVIFVVTEAAELRWAEMGFAAFVGWGALVGLVTVGLGTATFLLVEQPFMRLRPSFRFSRPALGPASPATP